MRAVVDWQGIQSVGSSENTREARPPLNPWSFLSMYKHGASELCLNMRHQGMQKSRFAYLLPFFDGFHNEDSAAQVRITTKVLHAFVNLINAQCLVVLTYQST